MVFCRGPGGNLPPNRMLCIRENEKTPEEKACFLSRRFLRFRFARGCTDRFSMLHAEKRFIFFVSPFAKGSPEDEILWCGVQGLRKPLPRISSEK